MKEIVIPKPFDAHYHFRDDFRLGGLIEHMVKWFSRATAMPNLDPPIRTGPDAMMYKARIQELARNFPGGSNFEPVMTIYITPETTPHHILEAHSVGVRAAKLYPKHGTTGSGYGIYDYGAKTLHAVFDAMQECGMLLLVHGEVPDPEMDPQLREAAFKPILETFVEKHPSLRVVFEHISSKVMVETIVEMPDRVAASVTAHHLFLTWEEVKGNPHHLCMPIAKSAEDREALHAFVLSGNKKALFGSDGAPHPRNKKEGVHNPSFGVWTGPTTIPLVIDLLGATHPALSNFLCRNAEHFYGLEPTKETLTLVNEEWVVPDAYVSEHESGGVVPFMAGESMSWQITPPS